MIPENSDPFALTAQADIHRFFIRIIHPALTEFTPGPDVPGRETSGVDVFLERARANTHNELCYEMRRAFALIIGGMFERQLRSWLASGAPDQRRCIERAKLPKLESMIEQLRGISLPSLDVVEDIRELWLVANAVRHGEGGSMTKLAKHNSLLWNHPVANTPTDGSQWLVSNMRVKGTDLRRYTLAIMKFWFAAGASSIPGI